MKKLILSTLLALVGFVYINAQDGFRIGAQIGPTVGDAADVFGVNYGADLFYMVEVIDRLSVGGKVGIDVFSGKDIANSNSKLKNMTLIPIAASGQFDFTDQFFGAADVGFALSLNNDYNGGFYFMPKGGWQNEHFQVFGFLKAISSKIDHDLDLGSSTVYGFSNALSVGIGGAYKF